MIPTNLLLSKNEFINILNSLILNSDNTVTVNGETYYISKNNFRAIIYLCIYILSGRSIYNYVEFNEKFTEPDLEHEYIKRITEDDELQFLIIKERQGGIKTNISNRILFLRFSDIVCTPDGLCSMLQEIYSSSGFDKNIWMKNTPEYVYFLDLSSDKYQRVEEQWRSALKEVNPDNGKMYIKILQSAYKPTHKYLTYKSITKLNNESRKITPESRAGDYTLFEITEIDNNIRNNSSSTVPYGVEPLLQLTKDIENGMEPYIYMSRTGNSVDGSCNVSAYPESVIAAVILATTRGKRILNYNPVEVAQLNKITCELQTLSNFNCEIKLHFLSQNYPINKLYIHLPSNCTGSLFIADAFDLGLNFAAIPLEQILTYITMQGSKAELNIPPSKRREDFDLIVKSPQSNLFKVGGKQCSIKDIAPLWITDTLCGIFDIDTKTTADIGKLESLLYQILRLLEQIIYSFTTILSVSDLIAFDIDGVIYLGVASINPTVTGKSVIVGAYNGNVPGVFPLQHVSASILIDTPEDSNPTLQDALNRAFKQGTLEALYGSADVNSLVPEFMFPECLKGIALASYLPTSTCGVRTITGDILKTDTSHDLWTEYYFRQMVQPVLDERKWVLPSLSKYIKSYGLRALDYLSAPVSIYGGLNHSEIVCSGSYNIFIEAFRSYPKMQAI